MGDEKKYKYHRAHREKEKQPGEHRGQSLVYALCVLFVFLYPSVISVILAVCCPC